MSPTDSLGVSWLQLYERLDAACVLDRWADAEPVLAGVGSVRQLARAVHDRSAPARSDALLGAVVRLAAVDGGGDEEAALLVAHLLDNGSCQLAVQLRDLSREIDEVVAGALWIQIRTFPWRRRRRAFARSLLLDTRKAVLGEICPYRIRTGRNRVVLRDPQLLAESTVPSAAAPAAGPGLGELRDLLVWARRAGAIDGDQVRLLLDLVEVAHRTDGQAERVQRRGLNVAADIEVVAARWGLNERTVRRRRDRALVALREVRGAYLAAVA